jgi:hypothetical protein
VSSLELGDGVAVALEGSVDDVGARVVEVGHDGLVLGAVPSDVAGLAVAVPVDVLVVHVEDGLLTSHPLAVGIGHRGVSGQHAGHVPVEQVGVVGQGLGVVRVVVHHDGAVGAETAANSAHDEVDDPGVGEAAAHVEVLDGQLADHEEAEDAADLGAGGVGGGVEVGAVDGAGHFVHGAAGEPGLEHREVVLGLVGPGGHALLEVVLRQTKADQLVVGHVLRDLGVNLSALEIIVGVLLDQIKG